MQDIQNGDRFAELKEAAQPLVDFLYKYHNPMCKVIVEMGYVEVVENCIGTPIEIKD